VFTASNDEARPVLMGVLLTVNGDQITMASADGFRLSVRKATLSSPAQKPLSAVIPARALSELARIAGDGDDVISMIVPEGRSQVVFRVKDAELTSQLIEGTFPDYEQIIPTSHKSRTIVSTKAIMDWSDFSRVGSQKVIDRSIKLGILEAKDEKKSYDRSYHYKKYIDIFIR